MAHAGEPVGNARALLGNLFQDSGTSVTDDVVVALHVAVPRLTSLQCPAPAQGEGKGVEFIAHYPVLSRPPAFRRPDAP